MGEDAGKLKALLRLESAVRSIADADENQRQRTLADLEAHLAARIKSSLTPYDVRLIDSALEGLTISGDQERADAAQNHLAEAIARSDDSSLQDLAHTLEMRRPGLLGAVYHREAILLAEAGKLSNFAGSGVGGSVSMVIVKVSITLPSLLIALKYKLLP